MKPESGDTRNATAWAMSSGFPMRRTMAFAASLLGERSDLCGRASLCDHFRFDESGRHGIDGDAVRPQFHGEPAGEHRDRGFGGGVKSRAGHSGAVRGDRRQIDDPSEAARLHSWYDGAGGGHQAIHVRPPHPFHLGVVEVRQVSLAKDAGVVDQDVDGARLGFECFDHGAHGAGVADVGAQRQCAAALVANVVGQDFSVMSPLTIIDPYGSTLPSQPQGNGPADSARGPGDQRGSSFQRHDMTMTGAARIVKNFRPMGYNQNVTRAVFRAVSSVG